MAYSKVKNWRRRTKERAFLCFGGQCGHCSIIDDPVVYDFHHIDSNGKDFGIAGKIRSWDVIREELKKCVMLCVFCHRKLHAGLIELTNEINRFVEVSPVFEDAICQSCSGSMTHRTKANKFCSRSCSILASNKVAWNDINLIDLISKYGNYSAAGRALGVSATTIKNRLNGRVAQR